MEKISTLIFLLLLITGSAIGQIWENIHPVTRNYGRTFLFENKKENIILTGIYADSQGGLNLEVLMYSPEGELLDLLIFPTSDEIFEEDISVTQLTEGLVVVGDQNLTGINENLDIEWSIPFDGAIEHLGSWPDGNLLVLASDTVAKPFLQTYDPAGTLIASDTIPVVVSPNIGMRMDQVIPMEDGGIMIKGWNVGKATSHVLRYDANRNFLWDFTYERDDSTAYRIYKLVPDPAGGFYFGGVTSIVSPGLPHDIFVGRLSENGELEWTRKYDYLTDDSFYDLIYTSGGELLLSGWAFDFSWPPPPNNAFLMGLDVQTGEVTYTELRYQYTDSLFTAFVSLYELIPGQLNVLGTATLNPGDNSFPTVFFADEAGSYFDSLSFFTDQQIRSGRLERALVASDGSIYYSGVVYINESIGSKRICLVKSTEVVTSTVTEDYPHQEFKLFPNPASDQITIEAIGTGMDVRLSLIDMFGRKIKERNVNANDFPLAIRTGHLTAGPYFIHVSLENGTPRILPFIVK